MKRILAALLLLSAVSTAFAAEKIDLQTVGRIRSEGFRNSKVMDHAAMLTDRYGSRLTGSPELLEASNWAAETLKSFGLVSVHLEPWAPFGRGWTWEFASLRMISPSNAQFYAIPKAWSPATNGLMRGKAVVAKLSSVDDFEKYRGKLKGAIVLNGELKEMKPAEKVALFRHDEKSLKELEAYPSTGRPWGLNREEWLKRRQFRGGIAAFLTSEGAIAIVEPGEDGEGGTFGVVSAYGYETDQAPGIPSIAIPVEQFNRMVRLADRKIDIELETEVRAKIDNEQRTSWNVIADIPGTDKKDEVVMLGAHIDAWHAGTGATDNAAGVAAVMEAARIISSLGVKPRRTIRIALWSGEEEGILGSGRYVAEHYGEWSEPKDPEEKLLPFTMRKEKGTLAVKREYQKLSAYFNLDNGTGKIRGIYAQENLGAAQVFREWLEPLHDLGATTVTLRNTGSTDHVPFDSVGLPGFQFIQDWVEYSRTHHSNNDTFERLQKNDLMQASVVMATFAWNAANRDEILPRKALPK